MADNTVILRVQLDEGKTEDKLKQLVLSIEATRNAQKALTAERKAGTIADEEFTKRSVALDLELKAQRQEYAANTKNLELYRAAQNGQADSYKATQAALSLAIRQQQELAGSADDSSEASQALTKQIAAYRDMLTATDAKQKAFFRNIGNYPKNDTIENLVKQLVTLQEQEKRATAGTEEAMKVRAQIGYVQQAAAQAGAKEGRTFEETTDFIRQYGEAIRPATADLVKLAQQQEEVTQSGEAMGEEIAQIGFKIGAAQKSIDDTTAALKQLPPAAEETGSAAATAFGQASEAAELLGVDTSKLQGGFERAKKGVDIAKASFGTLRTAMLAVPIFLLLAGLTALVAYFTKTREGANQLEAGVAKVGAVFDVIIDRAGILGKAVAQLFSGNFKAAAETARQSYQGIGDEMEREIDLADRLTKARQQLERDEINNIDTNKRLLNQVERLKNVRDNEFNTIQARKGANEAAYKVELEREKTLTDLAQRKADLLLEEINRRGGLDRANNDQLKAYKEALNEVSDIQEDAAGKQNELITNRYQLEQEAIDKSIERRAQAFAAEAALLNKRLAEVQINSDEELAIQQRLLRNEYQAELNVKKLTVAQKLAIDTKYEQDSRKLLLDTVKLRALAAYDAEAAAVNAELALVKKGTQQETELRVEAINSQLAKELAALDQRKDNAAQEAQLRANAAKAITDVNYAAAQANLEKYLQGERNALDEAFARNKIREEDYNKAVLTSDVMGAAARLQLAKSFTQDETALDQQLTAAKIASIKAVGEKEREEQAKHVAQAQQLAEGLTSLLAETVATTGATLEDFSRKALILVIDSIEKTIIAAQIKILAEAFASPESIATFGIAGFVKSAAIIGIVTAASETLKAKLQPPPEQFAGGTVLGGAYHEHGGVQLYSRAGHHYGEAEKNEIILTKGVYENPLLRPIASALNVMGGGKELIPRSHLAVGGITSPLVAEQLRGDVSAGFDYNKLATAMSRVKVKATISDVQAGLDRKAFTDSQANS
jgi:hypothetical protein